MEVWDSVSRHYFLRLTMRVFALGKEKIERAWKVDRKVLGWSRLDFMSVRVSASYKRARLTTSRPLDARLHVWRRRQFVISCRISINISNNLTF